MILITTSRKPCVRTRRFCKDLQKALPGSHYATRGKSNLRETLKEEKTIYVTDRKGNPGRFEVYHRGNRLLSISIRGVRLSDESKKAIPPLEGELSKSISDILDIKEGIIMQYDDSIVFKNGPEIMVSKVE